MNELIAQGIDIAQHGFGMQNHALGLIQAAAGGFFALSGYNKLFNPGRHAAIVQTLKGDKVPFVGFNQWFVPGNEFVGGIVLLAGLVIPGMPVAFFAAALFILLGVACLCEARDRVRAYQPINKADMIDDYLYLPEVVYMVMLGAIIGG